MDRTSLRIAKAAFCLVLVTGAAITLHAQDDAAPQGTGPGAGQAGAPGRGMRGRGIRGTVVSTSGANVTIKTEAGETWTVVTTDNTRVNIDRQTVKVADLKPGDEVMAMGLPDADKHEIHAIMLAGASAAQAAKLKADMGKTYIVGRITRIDDVKITVMRPDKVSQTILLDENSALRRGGRMTGEAMMGGMFGGPGGMGGGGRRRDGTPNATSGGNPESADEGEAITVQDVKIGDNVGGTGLMKNGIFVPAVLHVVTPRPRPAGAPAPAQ